jgi:hypothetical protein
MTIVGVVADVRYESLDVEVYPEVFIDFRQFLSLSDKWGESVAKQHEMILGLLSFAIRTTDDPASASPLVRQIISEPDCSRACCLA